MKRALSFVKAVSRHWGSLVTGGFFIGILTAWQLTGHSVKPWIGMVIILVAVVVACFLAWNDQQNALEAAQEPSKLVVTQKADPGYSEVKKHTFAGYSLVVTMLVSNQSSKPNSVLEYEAVITKINGTEQPLKAGTNRRQCDEQSGNRPNRMGTGLSTFSSSGSPLHYRWRTS